MSVQPYIAWQGSVPSRGRTPYSQKPISARALSILRAVALERGVTVEDIQGQCRVGIIAHARQQAYFELRQLTPRQPSYRVIGEWCGGVDHSTVHHGIDAYIRRRASSLPAAVYQGRAL